MCGIVGVVSKTPVNQMLYDALLLLQHRGQDAAGIATDHSNMFSMHKANGLVRDVFRTRNMRSLQRQFGHRPRALSDRRFVEREEAQPFYVNAPFGITFAHNGNLTNWRCAARTRCTARTGATSIRQSDSEVLLNVLAHELHAASKGAARRPAHCSRRWTQALHKRARGAYAAVAQIAGYGLLAFRDPQGMRPLCLGARDRCRHRIHAGQRSRWRWKAWASPSCATWRRARRCSSTSTATLHQQQCADGAAAPTSVRVRIRQPGAAGLGDRRRLGVRGAPEAG
jgi:amidophosphoribosyltransferase